MKNYFFCLLPKENSALHLKVKSLSKFIVSPEIKHPLHLTVYFLSKLNERQINKAEKWLDNVSLRSGIKAKVSKLSSFSKEGKEFVFFLGIESDVIEKLNSDLFNNFQDFHQDKFSFIAHVSMFYPQSSLSEQAKTALVNRFQDMQQISFDRLALASEKEGVIELEKVVSLAG